MGRERRVRLQLLETIDNPEFVERVLGVASEDLETRASAKETYTFLPIWRADHSPSGATPPARTLRFGAADRRYPGMHIPPHIAYEIDLSACPRLCGDNELAIRLLARDARIGSDCMVEAVEVDIGWGGCPQRVGYLL